MAQHCMTQQQHDTSQQQQTAYWRSVAQRTSARFSTAARQDTIWAYLIKTAQHGAALHDAAAA
jgi:hypothetical protein